jgi:hypothetical protein
VWGRNDESTSLCIVHPKMKVTLSLRILHI